MDNWQPCVRTLVLASISFLIRGVECDAQVTQPFGTLRTTACPSYVPVSPIVSPPERWVSLVWKLQHGVRSALSVFYFLIYNVCPSTSLPHVGPN